MQLKDRFSSTYTLLWPVVVAIVIALLPVAQAAAQDDFSDLFGGDPPTTPDGGPDALPSDDVPPEEAEPIRFLAPNFPLNPAARDAYLSGYHLAREGQYRAAIAWFNEALSFDSRFVDALYERGLAFAALHETDRAIESLVAAANNLQGSATGTIAINRTLGQLLMDAQRYREAAEAFGLARQQDPIDPDLQLLEASALVRFGLELQATDLNAAAELFTVAIEEFDDALDEVGGEAEMYFLRGTAHFQTANLEDALDDLQRAQQINPTEWKYVQRVGFIYLQLGNEAAVEERDEEARSHYRSAVTAFTAYLDANPGVTEYPGDSDLRVEDEEVEDPDKLEPVDIYIARAVSSISLAIQLPADSDERADSLNRAIADCESAIVIDPDRAVAYFNRGLAQRLLEEYFAAVASFSEAIRVSPGYTEAHLRRAIVWFHLDEPDLALLDLDAAKAALFAIDLRIPFWRGLIHARTGEFSEAIVAYSEVLRANPNHEMARTNRGLAYLNLDQPELAIEDFNFLAANNPDDAMPNYRRGLAYEQLDRDDAAARAYQRAVQIDPTFEEARRRLAGVTGQ